LDQDDSYPSRSGLKSSQNFRSEHQSSTLGTEAGYRDYDYYEDYAENDLYESSTVRSSVPMKAQENLPRERGNQYSNKNNFVDEPLGFDADSPFANDPDPATRFREDISRIRQKLLAGSRTPVPAVPEQTTIHVRAHGELGELEQWIKDAGNADWLNNRFWDESTSPSQDTRSFHRPPAVETTTGHPVTRRRKIPQLRKTRITTIATSPSSPSTSWLRISTTAMPQRPTTTSTTATTTRTPFQVLRATETGFQPAIGDLSLQSPANTAFTPSRQDTSHTGGISQSVAPPVDTHNYNTQEKGGYDRRMIIEATRPPPLLTRNTRLKTLQELTFGG